MAGWLIDDAARIETLRGFGIMDSEAEDSFDMIVAAAAAVCETPVALVTLLEHDRQWFKAKVGTDVPGTPIGMAICTHTLAHGGPLTIPDLAADPRTRDNALVTGDPYVRFYSGVPIVSDGQAVGTLCVLDVEPRAGLTPQQANTLEALALDATRLIEARG